MDIFATEKGNRNQHHQVEYSPTRSAEAWFRPLEPQFALAGIITDATRFNPALIGLDEESIGFVAKVLEECPY